PPGPDPVLRDGRAGGRVAGSRGHVHGGDDRATVAAAPGSGVGTTPQTPGRVPWRDPATGRARDPLWAVTRGAGCAAAGRRPGTGPRLRARLRVHSGQPEPVRAV